MQIGAGRQDRFIQLFQRTRIRYRIMLAAYNPRDALSLLACKFVLLRCQQAMREVSEQEFHEWVRSAVPEGDKLLDLIEEGWTLEQTPGLPVTPGEERYQLPIIGWLRQEQERQRATVD